jgi:hypothetical protein
MQAESEPLQPKKKALNKKIYTHWEPRFASIAATTAISPISKQ